MSANLKIGARVLRPGGAVLAYGAFAGCVAVLTWQLYRWMRDGEWTHVGAGDGLRMLLEVCCVRDGDVGRLATLAHWLQNPTDWLGWHKVLDVTPASIGLFLLSVLGNFAFVRGSDLLRGDGGDGDRCE
jgi:hypothetical protein